VNQCLSERLTQSAPTYRRVVRIGTINTATQGIPLSVEHPALEVEGEKKRVKGGGREEKSQRWRERRKESKVEGDKKRVKVEMAQIR
jgi:hypothetical protein